MYGKLVWPSLGVFWNRLEPPVGGEGDGWLRTGQAAYPLHAIGVEFDSESYAHIILFYGLVDRIEEVERFIKEASEAGLQGEPDVALATVKAYTKARKFDLAKSVFDEFKMANVDIAPLRPFYGVLIEGFAGADDIDAALKLFRDMQKEPNYRHPARNFTTNPLLEYYARKGDLAAFMDLFDKLTPVYLNRPDQRSWRSRIDAEVIAGKHTDASRTFYRHIRNKTVIKRDALLSAIPAFVASDQLNVLLRLFLAMESWIPFRDNDVADALATSIPEPSVFMTGLTVVTEPRHGPFHVIKSIEIKAYEHLAPDVRGMFFKMYADSLVRAGELDQLEALVDEARKPEHKFLPRPRPNARKPAWAVICLRPAYNVLVARNAEMATPGQSAPAEGATSAEAGLPKALLLHSDMLAHGIQTNSETMSAVMLAHLNAENASGAMELLDAATARGFRMPVELLSRLVGTQGLTPSQVETVKVNLKESTAAEAAEPAVDARGETAPVALFA